MTKMARALGIAVVLSIAGCSGALLTQETAVPSGSVLKLNTPLRIGRHSAHMDVQYGQASMGVDTNDPFCKFEVDKLAGDPGETLAAAVYKVTNTNEYTRPGDAVMAEKMRALQIAAAGPIQLAQSMQIDMDYITDMEIAANASPSLQHVICHNVMAADIGRFLTLVELNKVLRPTAEIVTP